MCGRFWGNAPSAMAWLVQKDTHRRISESHHVVVDDIAALHGMGNFPASLYRHPQRVAPTSVELPRNPVAACSHLRPRSAKGGQVANAGHDAQLDAVVCGELLWQQFTSLQLAHGVLVRAIHNVVH